MVASLYVDTNKRRYRSLTRWNKGMMRPLQNVIPTGSTSLDAMSRMGAEHIASGRNSQGPKFNTAQSKLIYYGKNSMNTLCQ